MARQLNMCFKELRVCLTTLSIPPGTARHITTTPAVSVGGKHRYAKGEAMNNSSYGPLTDLPDYTYLDGRPSELSIRQSIRRKRTIEMASTVATYISELMEAKKTHQKRLELRVQEHEEFLKSQLKPKTLK